MQYKKEAGGGTGLDLDLCRGEDDAARCAFPAFLISLGGVSASPANTRRDKAENIPHSKYLVYLETFEIWTKLIPAHPHAGYATAIVGHSLG